MPGIKSLRKAKPYDNLDRYARKALPGYISNRGQFWRQYPVIAHGVDSVANVYGINPGMLRDRLDREGAVDEEIRIHNMHWSGNNIRNGYDIMHANVPDGYGFKRFGLDDVGTMLNEGKVKPKGETYSTGDAVNEPGRKVLAASGKTWLDNVGLTAATLRYFTDLARSRHNDLSDYEINRYASGYFNKGPYGTTDEYLRNNPNAYRYKYLK